MSRFTVSAAQRDNHFAAFKVLTSLIGSAPDISGKGVVNPIGTILSVAMMLRYSLNLDKEAAAVEAAVKKALDNGVRTKDLGGSVGTKEMGDAVVTELKKLLGSS
jgi:3-isopropylmalate dehydrogenase